MAKRNVIELTNQEVAIIDDMRKNPLWGLAQFTDYFMRGDDTGSWITEDEDDFVLDAKDRYSGGEIGMYQYLYEEWKRDKPGMLTALPPMFASYYAQSVPYTVEMVGGMPAFFWYHGWIPLEWGAMQHYARQKEHTILGGFGTSCIDSRVFDAELRQYVTMRWLIENNRAPVVLSLAPDGWKKVKASIPYYEGTGPMYRVTTASGKVMDVGVGHRFLTTQGYVHIQNLAVGDSLVVPDKLPATVHGDASCGLPGSETAPDYQGRCSSDSRLCDEQPLHRLGVGQVPAPPHADVQGSPRPGCRIYDPCPRTTPDSTRVLVLHDEPGAPLRWREATCAPPRPEQATQVLLQSASTTIQHWQDVLESRCIDLAPTAVSVDGPSHIGWLYHASESDPIALCDEPQDAGRLPQGYGAHQQVPATSHYLTNSNRSAYSLLSKNGGNYTTTDTVLSIEPLGDMDFYDIHVPVYHNYVAEGMIHHNCSKTAHVGMSGFVFCATVPRFRFVCVAAYLSNAKPMFQEIKNAVEDTPSHKFVARSRNGEYMWSESPSPRIRFYNGSEMLFIGADKDISKVRSESGDWYVVEQSESHSDLEAVTLELGTRGRGRVRGRKRLGRLTFIANSGESPALWDRFDKAEDEPEVYWSINLSSYMNAWLSEEDIEKLERSCGGDTDTIDQYMRGLKPVGKYKSFPKSVVLRCQSEALDRVMKSLEDDYASGARTIVERAIGHTLWSLPYRKNRDYAVYGDPGTKNPPSRGAGVVMVFDETNFPNQPAEMVHFHWVAGDGRIGPWLNAFEDAINRYNAHGRAYFEGTGDQKMLDELSFEDRQMVVQRVDMSQIKYGYFLKTLRIMERGLLRWPKNLSPMRVQMSKYDVDKDKASSTMPQDIVMVMLIVGGELSKRFIPRAESVQKGAGKRAIRGIRRKQYRRVRKVYRGNRM